MQPKPQQLGTMSAPWQAKAKLARAKPNSSKQAMLKQQASKPLQQPEYEEYDVYESELALNSNAPAGGHAAGYAHPCSCHSA